MPLKTVMLLGATFNTNNMGVSALTAGTVKCIKSAWPDVRIQIIDYGKTSCEFTVATGQDRVSVPMINIRFSKKIFSYNHIVFLILIALTIRFLPGSIKDKIIQKNATLKSIYEGDLYMSIAGGDSFSDIYGIKRFFYVCLPQLLVIFLGKDLLQLPQTYGPYKSTISRIVSRYILDHSKIIYSRDRTGRTQVEDLIGIEETERKFRFAYDMGFALSPIKPTNEKGVLDQINKRSGDRLLVGVNVSGLLYRGGYTRNNMFGLAFDYRTAIDRLIEYIIKEKSADVLLVPHVFGEENNFESDTSACKEIFRTLSKKYPANIFVADGKYDQHSIKWMIGLCDLFVGARMHACIAAISQCIPTLSIAYSGKFFGLMQSIHCEQLVADARSLDADGLIGCLDELFSRRTEWDAYLKTHMPDVVTSAVTVFKNVDLASVPR